MKMINIDQKWYKRVKTLKGIKSAFSWTFDGAGVIYSRHLWTSQHQKKYEVSQEWWTDEACGSVRLPLHVDVDVVTTNAATTAQQQQYRSTITITPSWTPPTIPSQPPAYQPGSLYATYQQHAHISTVQ